MPSKRKAAVADLAAKKIALERQALLEKQAEDWSWLQEEVFSQNIFLLALREYSVVLQEVLRAFFLLNCETSILKQRNKMVRDRKRGINDLPEKCTAIVTAKAHDGDCPSIYLTFHLFVIPSLRPSIYLPFPQRFCFLYPT